jgi:hypothetical protein
VEEQEKEKYETTKKICICSKFGITCDPVKIGIQH